MGPLEYMTLPGEEKACFTAYAMLKLFICTEQWITKINQEAPNGRDTAAIRPVLRCQYLLHRNIYVAKMTWVANSRGSIVKEMDSTHGTGFNSAGGSGNGILLKQFKCGRENPPNTSAQAC